MTSQINANNIDGNYPVAGQPNNTQGMRDNFTNTKTNFQFAADEITNLQNNVVLKAALPGTTLDNNMNNSVISAVKLNDVSYTYVPLTATAGSITIDYAAGGFQQINASGPCSLSFVNWPATGSAGVIRLGFNITNVSQTLTLPAVVTQGVATLAGVSPGTPGVTNTITFGSTSNYAFEFVTVDGGINVWVFDDSRSPGIIATQLTLTDTTASTSDNTGALVVAGGIGVSGNLNVGGDFTTYSNGDVAFQATESGEVSIFNANVPGNTAGALNIVGSSDGGYQPVYNAGSMIHLTSNDNTASRFTNDSFGAAATSYPIMTMRRARGTATSPTAIQTGDIMGRVSASGWGTSNYVLAAGNIATNSIDIVALENHSTANAGSSVQFYTSPVGAVTRTLSANVTANLTTFPGNVAASNVIVSGSSGVVLTDGGTVGYGTGAGGTQVQSGNKSGPVTLNKPSGEITMQNNNLAAATTVSFTLTNSTISNHDVLLMNIVGGVATPAAYNLDASCNTGSAVISVRNITAGTLGEAIVIRYVVIKGSIA